MTAAPDVLARALAVGARAFASELERLLNPVSAPPPPPTVAEPGPYEVPMGKPEAPRRPANPRSVNLEARCLEMIRRSGRKGVSTRALVARLEQSRTRVESYLRSLRESGAIVSRGETKGRRHHAPQMDPELSSPRGQTLLRLLEEAGPQGLSPSELARRAEVARDATTQHLRHLRNLGLIVSRGRTASRMHFAVSCLQTSLGAPPENDESGS